MESGAPFLSKKDFQKTDKYLKKLCIFAGELLTRSWVAYWFDVNRSTFHEDMRKGDFYIFVPSVLDL